MNRREGLLAYFLVAAALIGAFMSRAADTRHGDWTLHRSDEPGKFEFTLIHNQHGNSSHHSSTWPLAAFVGLDVSDQTAIFQYRQKLAFLHRIPSIDVETGDRRGDIRHHVPLVLGKKNAIGG